MGQILHGSARTTEGVRRAIHHSQESLRVLAKRNGINQKTVAKWKHRTAVKDLPTGPKDAHSTVLSIEDEAVIVAFRKHTLLPLDDCLYALQATIPHLTRSSLHRCLQRHGISRLPEVTGDKEPKRKFKTYPIGYFHVDIAEVQTAEGKLRLLVAIDQTSKFAFVEVRQEAGKMIAAQFQRNLIAAVPYAIHTVLTDNGIQFTNTAHYKHAFHRIFDRVCDEHRIEHRLTKIKHSWTNGQVERMNRTIKEATVKRYHYDSHAQLTAHLQDFINAYNYGRLLKTLHGLTPYEFKNQEAAQRSISILEIPQVAPCRHWNGAWASSPAMLRSGGPIFNPPMSGTKALIDAAVMGPMPGIVASRFMSGSRFTIATIAFSNFPSSVLIASSWVASSPTANRATGGTRSSSGSRMIAIKLETLSATKPFH